MDRIYSRRELLQIAARTFVLTAAMEAAEEAMADADLPHRPLGKTGISLPILGFGTASAGIRHNIENAVQLYNAAADQGVTYFDTAPGKNGVFAALQKAKANGLTRFVGVSGHHRPSRFLRVIAEVPIDIMMCAVNFADRHTYNFEEKVFPRAAEKGIGLVAMKVFGGADWNSRSMVNSMVPSPHLPTAFRYALSLPSVALSVVGMATEEELKKNVAWAKRFLPLTEQERQALAAVGRKLADNWGAHYGATG